MRSLARKRREKEKHWEERIDSGDLAFFLLFRKTPSFFSLNLVFSFSFKNVKTPQGVRSDVKFIACEACEALARHAALRVSQLREEKKKEVDDESSSSSSSPPSRFRKAPPAKGFLTEAEILDLIEAMADPDTDAGEWLTHFDFEIKRGSKVTLKDKGERGKCGSRCRTVAMAAADCLEGTDTDLAERLWRGGAQAGPEEVAKWLCREETSACSSANSNAQLPATRARALAREIEDSPFSPESSEDAQMRQMMSSMKAQGMGGQMFDRQSVLKSLKEDGEDEEDEEEEEGAGGEKDEKAAAEAEVKATLAEAMEADREASAASSSSTTPSTSSPSPSSGPSERAERAKEAAREGIAAAKGWLSAKKASLFPSSSSSKAESGAEL